MRQIPGKGREAVWCWKVPKPSASLYREELKGSSTPAYQQVIAQLIWGRCWGLHPKFPWGGRGDLPWWAPGQKVQSQPSVSWGQCLPDQTQLSQASSGPETSLGRHWAPVRVGGGACGHWAKALALEPPPSEGGSEEPRVLETSRLGSTSFHSILSPCVYSTPSHLAKEEPVCHSEKVMTP